MKIGIRRTKPMLLWLPLAGVLFVVVGTAGFLLGGCGIASYPYLVPPERVSAGDGFRHKSQVTSGVFRGYEIYYRIYAGSLEDGSLSKETIIEDLQSEFQYRSGFEKVSEDRDRDAALSADDSSSVDSPYWLAVASTNDTPPDSGDVEGTLGSDSPPLFPIDQSYGEVNTFDVNMAITTQLELSIADSGYPTGNPDYPKTIYLYRRVAESDTVLGFTPSIDDYATEYADVPEDVSEAEGLTVAFFSIIYGFDIGSFTTIFANSHIGQPADNIVFMGTLEAN